MVVGSSVLKDGSHGPACSIPIYTTRVKVTLGVWLANLMRRPRTFPPELSLYENPCTTLAVLRWPRPGPESGLHGPGRFGELMGIMQVLLQSRRLKIAAAVPEAQMLVQELMNFHAKIKPV